MPKNLTRTIRAAILLPALVVPLGGAVAGPFEDGDWPGTIWTAMRQ
jgi:hypothetical protein